MKSLIKSFKCAFSGIFYAIKRERNFRIHLTVVYYLVLVAYFAEITRNDAILIVICSGLVLMAELFNTSLELACDKMGKEFDILIKNAKDVSAGAVLVQAFASLVVGVTIFLPKIVTIIENINLYWGISILTSLPLAIIFIFKGEKE